MAQIGENCVRKRPEDWERVYACDDVVNAWDLHDFSTFAEISRDLSPEFSCLSIVTPKCRTVTKLCPFQNLLLLGIPQTQALRR